MNHDATVTEPPPASPAPRLLRRAGAEVLAAVAALACFANTLPNEYCFDDNRIVEANPDVSAPGRWFDIWTSDYWHQTAHEAPNRDLLYRPIAITSYRVVRVIGGASPLPQHLANVVLHALVAVLVVRLGRRMRLPEHAAALAGVLFAVLPIHTEAVAPVAGRADLLATFGVVAALLSHCAAMRATTMSQRVRWGSAAALAAFTAMGSKESGIAVLPLAVLFDALWRTEPQKAGASGRWRSRDTAARLSYLLLPLVAYIVLRFNALGGHLVQEPVLSKTVNVLVDAPAWQRSLGVVQLWGMYWAKTVWPDVLSVKYTINAIRLATGPLDPHVLIGLAVAGLFVVVSVVCWRRGERGVSFAALAMGVAYLPAANAFVLLRVFFAERTWYLPSVWAVILIAFALGGPLKRRVWAVAIGAVVVAMTARCWIRSAEWRNNGTLYAAAYRDQPDGVGALQLYGEWLTGQGEPARGIELLGKAVDIDLGFTDAHRSLADAYLEVGDLRAALTHLRTADMQVPDHPPTADKLTQVSRALAGRDAELAGLKRRAKEAPENADVQIALVRRLRDLGLTEEALSRQQAFDSRFTRNATWQAEVAVTFVYLNRIDEAIDRYRRSLDLAPNDPQRAVELAMLLLERRAGDDLRDAKRRADSAYEVAPGDPSVLVCLAEIAAVQGDVTRAIALYQQAIQSLPPDTPQRRAFEQRLRALGG
ncbi:MAG: tetratricopeptide repeat protein [Phycisphaerae bacterium]|jgi:tetratricopeptide (TPR) repeat protein